MPAIFFLALPSPGETGTGAEVHSQAERSDSQGYSGHLSFEGSFDQFGFVPLRSYPGRAELLATEHQRSADAQAE